MSKKQRYSSPLRESQAQITKRHILEAMADSVIQEGFDRVTHASIAQRAQVSERTLYRHFPSREALFDAFLEWVSERVGIDELPASKEELIALIPRMFGRMDDHRELVKACLQSRAWSQIWMRHRSGWDDAVRLAIATGNGSDPQRARLLGSVIHLLFSGLSWYSANLWGLSGKEAATAVTLAMGAIFAEMEAPHPAGSKSAGKARAMKAGQSSRR